MTPIDETSGIESVEVIPYALPFRRPYVTAKGSLDRREMVLLRIRTRDGACGARRSGAAVAAGRREPGRGDGPAAVLGGGRRRPPALGAPARCAIATALADAAARRAGHPAP